MRNWVLGLFIFLKISYACAQEKVLFLVVGQSIFYG